jgi:hypothetical protein
LNGLDCCTVDKIIHMVSPNPVVQGMTNLERRRTPRTTITGHAYVNIEPNNGGIVLNVSDEGLCFHSFDPVPRNGKVRFWFSERNRRIEAQAKLAWTDETQKAGLQFTTLPAEAREQIRQWMIQSATPLGTVDGSAPAALPPRGFPARPDKRAEIRPGPVGSAALGAVSTELKAPKQFSGFSRGLVTGLLVSAVVVAAFLFQGYRREFGESLIRLGERFAAKPQVQTVATPTALPAAPTAAAMVVPPPATPVVVPVAAPTPVPPSAKTSPHNDKAAIPPNKPVQPPQKVVSPPLANPVPTQPAKIEPARPATPPASTATAATAPKITDTTAPTTSSTPPATPSPTPVASAPNLVPAKPAPVPNVEAAKQPEVQTESSTAENAASTSELYFDVGKFKNQSQAHLQMDKLSQLGFPTTAVQKGFLWSNSYHILVGPYSDEERAKTTHQNLVSNGFKPRPFERGSRPFTLGALVTLNGTRTPPGDYIISWESSLDDASVKLLHNDLLVASANGRWVKRDIKFARDAYVYRRNADGSRTLLEIRFGGTHQALVFGKPS